MKNLPFKKTEKGLVLRVKVQPRSSKKGIEAVEEDMLKVRLSSAPVDGKANAELIGLLSKELGFRKSSISIIKGEKSRLKTVLIKEDF